MIAENSEIGRVIFIVEVNNREVSMKGFVSGIPVILCTNPLS
jgi:hypothetical protein